MKVNPVYRRETMVGARSMRLTLILLVFNSILAVVALLNMYATIAQARLNAEIQYSSFLEMYVFVAMIEFMLLSLIVPAITAGTISGERERQTLDLMMTTWLTPSDIILGKLASALSTMMLLAVSSFPVLALVFVYGGVGWWDVIMLLLCLFTIALLAGSLGIFCSCLFRKSTVSTAVSYGLLACLMIGTYGINYLAVRNGSFVGYGMTDGGSILAAFYGPEQSVAGSWLYLLMLNPSATFLNMLQLQTGNGPGGGVLSWFGAPLSNLAIRQWTALSIALQIALSAALLWASVRILQKKK